jgi:hypothetical protein
VGQAVGSQAELLERQAVVSVFGLYALYRRLCPPSMMPDGRLYKRLWSVQKELPLVLLAERAVWFAPEFLAKHAPFEVRKLEPQDVQGGCGGWGGTVAGGRQKQKL